MEPPKVKNNSNQITKPDQVHNHPDGLDKWNDRLDHNFESEKEGDEIADDNAKKYSEKYGSGDQSDEE